MAAVGLRCIISRVIMMARRHFLLFFLLLCSSVIALGFFIVITLCASQNNNCRASLEQVDSLLQQDYKRGRKFLSNVDSIRRANSDILPRKSYFMHANESTRPNNFGGRTEEELCVGDDEKKESCVGKFRRGLSSFYVVARKYRTLGCLIRKNMNNLLEALFCYLSSGDEEKIQAGNVTLSSIAYAIYLGLHKGFCANREHYRDKENQPLLSLLQSRYHHHYQAGRRELEKWEEWKFLTVVREPVDRFLSGFLDKCIRSPIPLKNNKTTANTTPCNGCGQNLTCFVITEYRRMKEFESLAKRHEFGQDAGFDDVKRHHRMLNDYDTYEDQHFFPQNWRCDFERLLPHYAQIVYSPASVVTAAEKSDNYQNQLPTGLTNHLARAGVGAKSLSYIRHHLVADTTHHVTHDTEARRFLEQRLRGSPFLMEFLVRMFYWDFRLLGFPLPKLNWGESD